jgi:choline dehydrogenase
MAQFDYVIVGAGSAGCVLANRLSANSGVTVALIEAGPSDAHPYVHMPRGVSKLVRDPNRMWVYLTQPESGTGMRPDYWLRGKVLGGSSSVNGMVYVRGHPEDFNAIAARTSDDWSWQHIGRIYAQLENHELGAAPTRGAAGPLRISLPTYRTVLTEALVAAGAGMGWAAKRDLNEPDDAEAIGYLPRNIHHGKRQSTAVAFLRPIGHRPNLTVLTEALVDRVIFDGKRAVGVELLQKGYRSPFRARREVILAAGALASPGILERSGIGDPKRLAALGVPLVHASLQVGENLIDHQVLRLQWRLRQQLSQNRDYSGWRLLRSVAQYLLTRDGPMSSAAAELRSHFRSRPDISRPDVQALISPYSWDLKATGGKLEQQPGLFAIVHPLRPTSRGRVHIRSREPDASPAIEPNFRATQEDRDMMVGAVRTIRRYMQQESLREFIADETAPGNAVQSYDEVMAAIDGQGICAYHGVGTCAMGKDESAVVDPQLRVRGLQGLRVIDLSVMPVIPSGNTNAPSMALAWRAAEIVVKEYD